MEKVAIEPKYQPYILKEYEYWTLLLNERQRYLGRAVIWLSRPGDMQRFSQLRVGELVESQRICIEYEAVLDRIGWKPDLMNTSMLGNFVHEHKGHGHMHIVPRYAPRPKPPAFMGIVFEDDRWGQNSSPETPHEIPDCVLSSLVTLLREELAKQV